MPHFNVRRLTAAVALVLVLAAAPALAVPRHRSHASQPPAAAHSLFDKILAWLILPTQGLPGELRSLFQKSTGTTSSDSGTTSSTTQRTGTYRGVQIDPNG